MSARRRCHTGMCIRVLVCSCLFAILLVLYLTDSHAPSWGKMGPSDGKAATATITTATATTTNNDGSTATVASAAVSDGATCLVPAVLLNVLMEIPPIVLLSAAALMLLPAPGSHEHQLRQHILFGVRVSACTHARMRVSS